MGWIRVEPNTLMSRIAIADGLIDENTGLLPETEEELDHLFYSCPTTRRYADPIFLMINQSVQSLLPLLRIVKKSFKGKKKGWKRYLS